MVFGEARHTSALLRVRFVGNIRESNTTDNSHIDKTGASHAPGEREGYERQRDER